MHSTKSLKLLTILELQHDVSTSMALGVPEKLFFTIMAFLRGRGHSVLPFAKSGIAATLLKGGRTVHSEFKLPVAVLDTSVSSMRRTFN